jgi:hypothetical protein
VAWNAYQPTKRNQLVGPNLAPAVWATIPAPGGPGQPHIFINQLSRPLICPPQRLNLAVTIAAAVAFTLHGFPLFYLHFIASRCKPEATGSKTEAHEFRALLSG